MSVFHLGRTLRPGVVPLVEAVANIIVLLAYSIQPVDYKTGSTPENAEHFDFIVVGSGSAGSVVGGRLSEVAQWDVLVLEAGAPPSPRLSVPAFYMTLFQSTEDWHYKTVPQKYAGLGYKDHRMPIPRGKTVGGTSATNAMLYSRGNQRDFDQWADLRNPGWDYKNVLKYFKKSEDFRGDPNRLNGHVHGYRGPMTVIKNKLKTPYQKMVVAGGRELGYSLADLNGPNQTGFMPLEQCIRNGERWSSADAFLRPHLNRRNLRILPKAFVTQILFDPYNRAIGVLYNYNGKSLTAYAKKEVILSAGAIDSPKLLMLSGLGNAEHLYRHKIAVRVNLPGVRSNLMDHMGVFGGLTFFAGKIRSPGLLEFIKPSNYIRYITRREGFFASVTGFELTGRLSMANNHTHWPDIDIQCASQSMIGDSGLNFYNVTGFDEKFFFNYFGEILNERTFNLNPSLLRPKSRGFVYLASNNASDPALIDPQTYSHPDDLELIVKAIKMILRLSQTHAFRKESVQFFDKPLPNCKHHGMWSDEYWRCFARFFTTSFHHAAGTCKMAPSSDPNKVVDSRLRVYGVKNLRVIDASVMPVIVSANTHATTVMIGEKGADMIKEDWGALKR